MIGVKSQRPWVKSIGTHGSIFQQTVPRPATQAVFLAGRCPISHHSGYQNAVTCPNLVSGPLMSFSKSEFSKTMLVMRLWIREAGSSKNGSLHLVSSTVVRERFSGMVALLLAGTDTTNLRRFGVFKLHDSRKNLVLFLGSLPEALLTIY